MSIISSVSKRAASDSILVIPQHVEKRVRAAITRTPSMCSLPEVSSQSSSQKTQESVEKVASQSVTFALTIGFAAKQGKRQLMEDSHFFKKIDEGYLMGIFDGHGDQGLISAMASRHVQDRFPALMKESPDAVNDHYKRVSQEIQDMVTAPSGGTAATICFVNRSNVLMAGGVGDTEVAVFHKMGDVILPYMLPTKRSWDDAEECKRVEEAFKNPELYQKWCENPPKWRYFPLKMGINLSRSLGDRQCYYEGRGAIDRTPICEDYTLHLGDWVVLACDGVWDVVTLNELTEKVISPHWNVTPSNMAHHIAHYVLRVKESSDNVTVICAQVIADEPWAATPPDN